MKFHLFCLIVAVLADVCKTKRTIEDLAVRNRKRRAVPVAGLFVDIQIRSEGCNDPGIAPGTCGIAYIKVNGTDYSPHGRGHNVVILDAGTGAVLDAKSFDTHGDNTAGNRLRDYLDNINGEKVVLVAIQDSGSNHFPQAVEALKRVGATDPILIDFRGSFALIGYAGGIKPPWIAQQQAHRHQGPSEISARIPLAPSPFVQIHVRSEGCNDPGIAPGTCGTAYIEVNGNDHSPHRRGHNVVIVDATTGTVIGTASFDTHGDGTAGIRLRDYLDGIQGDKIVLVAIQDEGSNHFTDAVDALKRVGATDPIWMDYRGSFALVGYAGFIRPAWIAQQQAHSNQGPSEIFLNIPLTILNVDECANNPCQNGAACVDLQGSYRCDCRPGYSGNNCETDVDECANNPCQNGAACVNLQGSYHCDCSSGYSGNNCEIDVDECANNPCQNGAICVNLQGSYRCDCTSGFSGNNCETDQEPPVLTNCPNDIVIDNVTEVQIRVNWDIPTVMDNSGVPPALTSNIPPGHLFAVPGSYEIQYKATDDAGNEATCSFRITLKRKSCFLYYPPKNGALACFSIGVDPSCVVMCKSGLDFVLNPPMVYFCTDGVWHFYGLPNQPYGTALPWPDCSNTANPSWLKQNNRAGLPGQGHFFDANDPNVQAAIQQNYIIVMKSRYVPPFFCTSIPECKEDNVQVFISTA